MNKDVLTNYEVNKNTLALLPTFQPDYNTIAIEPCGEYQIRKTPLQLIKHACLEGGSSYEGRREAVAYLIGAKNKVPIPINPLEQIYAFPTHSPKQFECSWIFQHHIRSLKPHSFPNQTKGSIITFKNNFQLTLPISYYTIEKQMQRTSYCMIRFSQPLFDLAKTELSY